MVLKQESWEWSCSSSHILWHLCMKTLIYKEWKYLRYRDIPAVSHRSAWLITPKCIWSKPDVSLLEIETFKSYQHSFFFFQNRCGTINSSLHTHQFCCLFLANFHFQLSLPLPITPWELMNDIFVAKNWYVLKRNSLNKNNNKKTHFLLKIYIAL